MSDVGTVLGKPRESKIFAPDDRWVLPKTRIGMEFEYEGVTDPATFYGESSLPNAWEQHREDSLKNYGAEFVFRTPMFGTDAHNAIVDLMTRAKAANFNCSVRAGIHVHIDARDMETPQLIGMTILYTILEPLLFRWIGQNRENSIFCVPFYKADESLLETCNVVKSVLNDEKFKTKLTLSSAKSFARYAAYNLNALWKFGSIEYRHMRTTHDIARVMDWINILMSLKAATLKFPASDGMILRLAKTTGAAAFLEFVFGPDLARKLWVPDAGTLIQKVGIPTARDLILYGLNETDWSDIYYPKGAHAGFAQYLSKLPDLNEPATPKKKYNTLGGAAGLNVNEAQGWAINANAPFNLQFPQGANVVPAPVPEAQQAQGLFGDVHPMPPPMQQGDIWGPNGDPQVPNQPNGRPWHQIRQIGYARWEVQARPGGAWLTVSL